MLREKLGVPADQQIPPIMIGAGPNKNLHHPGVLRRYSEAAAMTHGAVVFGSITPEPSPGNTGDLWYPGNGFTINSYGMPNDGVEAMPDVAPHPNLIVSLAGKTVGEYVKLYTRRWNWGLGAELNFGCPNTGSGNRILSFAPKTIEAVLMHIHRWINRMNAEGPEQRILGIKLSPYSDPMQLQEVANMLCKFEGILDYVATCNTFPSAKAFRLTAPRGQSAIVCEKTQNRGGLGGEALRHIRLGNAEQFVEVFAREGVDIDVVGVGGITRGLDIVESEDVGCKAVQVVSEVIATPDPIYRMVDEYLDLTGA